MVYSVVKGSPDYRPPHKSPCSRSLPSCGWRLWPSENHAAAVGSSASGHVAAAANPSSSSWHPP